MSDKVHAVTVDLESDGQVVWTWDPMMRILSVSEGDTKLGPNLIYMKYEDKTVSTSHVLGAQVNDSHPLAVLFGSSLLKENLEENPYERAVKRELLVSICAPSLYSKSKSSCARKIRDSIEKHLLCSGQQKQKTEESSIALESDTWLTQSGEDYYFADLVWKVKASADCSTLVSLAE